MEGGSLALDCSLLGSLVCLSQARAGSHSCWVTQATTVQVALSTPVVQSLGGEWELSLCPL